MYDMTSMEEYVSPELFEELFGVSSIMSMLSSIPGMLISLATYIAVAYSLYTIATRRGIGKPWLAWIPVVNVWTLGAIADDYQLKTNGQKKARRKVLLGLEIAVNVLALLLIILCVVMIIGLFANMDMQTGEVAEDAIMSTGLGAVGMLLLALPLMVVAIVKVIFHYIAYYDVFKSCDPGNAVLYLVLSIFINITQPVFLFLCRNKDDGMPKPQPEIPPAAWEPPAAPNEPWQPN